MKAKTEKEVNGEREKNIVSIQEPPRNVRQYLQISKCCRNGQNGYSKYSFVIKIGAQ